MNKYFLTFQAYEEGQSAAYCKKHFTSVDDPSPETAALAFTGWTCR